MVLPVRELLSWLSVNVERYGCPIPVRPAEWCGWARDLGLPKGGETVLYTSGLYQLVPYIEQAVKRLSVMEDKRVTRYFLRLGINAGRIVDLSKLFLRPSREHIEKYYVIPRTIAELLSRVGVRFGYLYEDDMYSGALLYDLGMDDIFARHAETVYSRFREHGVKTVITVDPHTTHVLRSVYPRYIAGNFDLEVKSYLEVLAEKEFPRSRESKGDVVIHDACVYARFEGVIEQPRLLLSAAGFDVLEPARSRELTFCCGGPVESLSPRMAGDVANIRLEELSEAGNRIVTTCPLCLANLSRAAREKTGKLEIIDISFLLAQGSSE